MAICETCSATFTPSLETTEVTSLRILCQDCEAKRRAEKALRASAGTPAAAPKAAASSGATASTTIRAVPRTPGSTVARTSNATPAAGPSKPTAAKPGVAKPAAAASNSAGHGAGNNAGNSVAKTNSVLRPSAGPRNSVAGNARPASSVSGEPAATRPSSSSRRTIPPRRSAPASSSSRKSRPSPSEGQARDLHGQVSKKLLHKPGRAKPDAEREGNFRPDVSREIAMLKQRESKVMTIAWIVCGVLVVAAAGFGLAAKMKHDNEVALAKKHRSDLDTLLVDAKSKYDIKTEDGALKLLEFLEGQKNLGWEDDTGAGGVGAELSTMISLSKANVEQIHEKKDQVDRLANIEATLSEASGKPMDDILKARRSLDMLVLKDTAYGDEFKTRVQAQVKAVDKIVLARLRQEAKTLAGAGPDKVRTALVAYSKAEDEATKLLDRAMQLKDEETKKFYTDQFKELMEESNTYVIGIFDQGMIESTAWTDLLSEENKKHWQNYGLQGFRIDGGKLEAIAQKGGATLGLVAVPDQGSYRDFTLDMEFTLTGAVDIYFRLLKRADNTVENWQLSTTGADPLKAGQTYTLQASYIGSKLIGSLTPADVSLANTESSWTKSRKGGIGFQMHDGAELRITRLRIRQLRDG